MAAPGGVERPRRLPVWDVPTRLIHWMMALLVPALWWTAEEGWFDWHRRAGYLMLGLIVFRLLWGVFGASTARFSSFVRGPAAVARYARKLARGETADFVPGHNPMGGWSVAAMLLALAIQVALGLFAVDVNGLEAGPLSSMISFDLARDVARLHETVFNILLALIALHVGAVVFYLVVRKDNLVAPMIHGGHAAPPGTEPMRPAPLWRAALAAAIAAGLAWWVSVGAPPLS